MKKLLFILIIHYSLLITHCYTQWVAQTLPVSGLVRDICFVDADTGFVATDTPALLKTTNGGTNWVVTRTVQINQIQFVDKNTGYAIGYVPTNHRVYKTTNCGNTWDSMFIGQGAYGSLSFINKDTGWIGGFNQSSTKMVWQTTNGGQTFQLQYSAPGGFISNIFFTKQNYSGNYYGWFTVSGNMHYTTNSGANWTQYTNMPNSNAGNPYFLNKDTGWVVNANGSQNYTMFTTNNGNNWIIQNLPSIYGAIDLYFHNSFTGWGAGGFGKVTKSVNSGFNWGYQDVPFFTVNNIFFLDNQTGWCGGNGIAKTTNGGGNITYIGIQQISSEIPNQFKLEQNYPNPFNPVTNIKYQIIKNSFVRLIIYDMLGKEIIMLVNQPQTAGIYLVDWNANSLPSGTYFYKLITDNYTETKKMILLK